jgi:uncharacterized membrane protein YgaE (UPF0421/DUF939 family)
VRERRWWYSWPVEAGRSVAIGLPLGIAIGVAVGLVLDNLAFGIAVGLVFAIAVSASRARKPSREEERGS